MLRPHNCNNCPVYLSIIGKLTCRGTLQFHGQVDEINGDCPHKNWLQRPNTLCMSVPQQTSLNRRSITSCGLPKPRAKRVPQGHLWTQRCHHQPKPTFSRVRTYCGRYGYGRCKRCHFIPARWRKRRAVVAASYP